MDAERVAADQTPPTSCDDRASASMSAAKTKQTERLAAASIAISLVYVIAGAHAEGPPTSEPLWYAGTATRLEDGVHKSMEGNHRVWLWLFKDAAPASTALCTVGPSDTGFDQGHFR